ncbi:MAG: DUF6794 domain-containing protein [Pseudomonadota bacterium]
MPLPQTVEGAVEVLLDLISENEQAMLADLPEEDLAGLQLGMGMWIRENMGLWQGNEELLADTGAYDPDDASAVIIRAFWSRVRAERGLQQP